MNQLDGPDRRAFLGGAIMAVMAAQTLAQPLEPAAFQGLSAPPPRNCRQFSI